ncbi:hypothetical protein [Micromonospora tulbaghiae]|uniref:hypothetical protein n=1 Tax=Micromonospora tulbaghiae TaxID=479978 RepID=UPI00341C9AC6
MNRYVERLARMVPPPARSSAPPSWPTVERSLGLTLPVPRLDLARGVAEAAETLRAYASSGEAHPRRSTV